MRSCQTVSRKLAVFLKDNVLTQSRLKSLEKPIKETYTLILVLYTIISLLQ